MTQAVLRIAFALSLCPAVALPWAAPAASAELQAQPSTRDLYLTLIRQARADGHARAAIAFLDDFDRTYPGDTDAAILRINCLLDLDQLDNAQAALAKLPTRRPGGEAHAVRGHVFAAFGNWDSAIAEYTEALTTTPSDSLVINALGYAQLRAGRAAVAVETLKRARELSPQDPVIRNNLLLALVGAGREEEADSLFARSGDDAFQADLRRQVTEEVARLAALSPKAAQP